VSVLTFIGYCALKDMKTCSRCKQLYPLDNFNKKKGTRDGLQSWCRDCNKARSRRYYAEHRNEHKKIIRVRADRIKIERQRQYCEYLSQHPCVDCGEDDIIVLEPDHLYDKERNLSEMIRSGVKWEKILNELEKCEIVCRNDHARRTHSRFQNGTFKTRFLGACPERLTGADF
jgi:hypothetical protein